MSDFTRKILDDLSSLVSKVSSEDAALSHVDPDKYAAELQARQKAKVMPGARERAAAATGSKVARKKREKAAKVREERIRAEREESARKSAAAQEKAFREAKARAARSEGPGPSSSRARRPAKPGPRRTSAPARELAKAYKTLNLQEGATMAEAKSAYRKLMRKYHPDMHNDSPKKQKAATELSVQVSAAFKILEDHLKA